MKVINFRVSDDEHKLMHAIAEHEGLTLTAYIRRHFILQGRELRIPTNNPATQNPLTPPAPMRDDTFTREVLLKRIEAGEQLRDVAASVGIQVSELQARVAKAKAARADGSLTRAQGAQEFMQANPAPDDGKEYKLSQRRNDADTGYEYAWVERRPAFDLPTPVDKALALAPHEHSDDPEENAARARAKLLAMGFYV